MAKSLFLLLLGVFPLLFGSPSFGAQTDQLKCRLSWNLPESKPGSKRFSLEDSYISKPYPSTQVETELLEDRVTSRWVITQFFGNRGTDYERYEVQCDLALNCKGSRNESIAAKETSQPLSFSPSTLMIGKIGEREIFRFIPKAGGFNYRFTQYELDNEFVGMELECHE